MNEAMNRLEKLECRLKSMESTAEQVDEKDSSSSNSSMVDLVEYQKQMLIRITEIRDTLVVQDGDINVVKEERDSLKESNSKLKKEVERLNYRISHLIKNME